MMSRSVSPSPDDLLEWQLCSDPAQLSDSRKRVEAFARTCGLSGSACNDLGLCANEALANIMRHAYSGVTDQPIRVTAQRLPDGVKLSIRDWGNGVNPASLPARPKDPTQPGGLGMICLRSLVDVVRFTPQPDGMLLEMQKKKA